MVTEQLSSDWEERDPEAESKLMAAALARVVICQTTGRFRRSISSSRANQAKSAETPRRNSRARLSKAPNSNPSTRSRSSSPLRRPIFAPSIDPAMKLVVSVVDENSPLAKKQTQILNTIAKVRPQYVAAIEVSGRL